MIFKLPERFFTHKFERDKKYQDPIGGNVTIELRSDVQEILGPAGRLISPSKSSYTNKYPDHDVLFNACVFESDGKEIWFGDIDVTIDIEKLKDVVDLVGEIYVTPESPFRFEGLKAGLKSYSKDRVIHLKK